MQRLHEWFVSLGWASRRTLRRGKALCLPCLAAAKAQRAASRLLAARMGNSRNITIFTSFIAWPSIGSRSANARATEAAIIVGEFNNCDCTVRDCLPTAPGNGLVNAPLPAAFHPLRKISRFCRISHGLGYNLRDSRGCRRAQSLRLRRVRSVVYASRRNRAPPHRLSRKQ